MSVNEIAKLANVSIGTVDRVLHNRGRVSEETRAKIQKIIKETGYQPNALARHLKRNCEYKIGVLIPEIGEEGGYWKQLYDGISAAAAGELEAFSFKVQLFPFIRPNRKSFSDQFKAMISSDCCAYIIAPVMQEETMFLFSDSSIKKPYCFIDSALPGPSPVCTVAQDPFRAGYLAGRMTELTAHRDGTFAVIRPNTEAYNQNERARGFSEWFTRGDSGKEAPVLIAGCESVPAAVSQRIDELLRDHPSTAGICMVNSATYMAADHIEKLGLKNEIAVTGFDLIGENCRRLKNGSIDCLISQTPERQGHEVMMQLYRTLVLEETCEKTIDIPLEIYFKENMN